MKNLSKYFIVLIFMTGCGTGVFSDQDQRSTGGQKNESALGLNETKPTEEKATCVRTEVKKYGADHRSGSKSSYEGGYSMGYELHTKCELTKTEFNYVLRNIEGYMTQPVTQL